MESGTILSCHSLGSSALRNVRAELQLGERTTNRSCFCILLIIKNNDFVFDFDLYFYMIYDYDTCRLYDCVN